MLPDLGSFIRKMFFQGVIRYPGMSLDTVTSTSAPGFFLITLENAAGVREALLFVVDDDLGLGGRPAVHVRLYFELELFAAAREQQQCRQDQD